MKHGFTLIELLVVITIIVVLLALLTPALDRAIYQAELAVCGAQMSGIAKGVTVYAMDFKRNYPYRQFVAEGQGDTSSILPWLLRIGDQAAGAKPSARDDRTPLRGYVDLKMLVDPLCEPVDLSEPTSWIYASTALWYGWSYKDHQGMTKLGNRISWTDARTTPATTYRVNWLVTDSDNPNGGAWIQGSHPDDLGLMHNMAIERGVKDSGDLAAEANGQTTQETNSKWVWWTGWDRGEIEMNAAAADGSVKRYNDVPTYGDERMAYAPKNPGSTLTAGSYPTRDGSTTADVPQYWITVPRQ